MNKLFGTAKPKPTINMIDLLNQCFADAEQENKQGIANFIAERLDAHGKHNWMLKSFLKDQRA